MVRPFGREVMDLFEEGRSPERESPDGEGISDVAPNHELVIPVHKELEIVAQRRLGDGLARREL